MASSVTSQTERSPRRAPMRIRPSTPIIMMNSGSTTGSESAVGFISYRLWGSSQPGRLHRRRGVLHALQQVLDRSRAGVEDRLRMHAVIEGEGQQWDQRELLA